MGTCRFSRPAYSVGHRKAEQKFSRQTTSARKLSCARILSFIVSCVLPQVSIKSTISARTGVPNSPPHRVICPNTEALHVKVEIPKTPFPEMRFPQIYEILEQYGKKLACGSDLDKEGENLLCKYVREKHKTDAFFINRFPFKVKPFYVMRVDDDPQWARSVDFVYRDLEQSSGGQA